MIQDHNLNISEPDYRDLKFPSYSLLASVSKQGVDVLQGQKSSFFELKFGSLVDDMCFEPSKLPNYYHGSIEKPPTGNPKKIADMVMDGITVNVGQDMTNSGFIKAKTIKITDNIEHYVSQCVAAAAKLQVYKNYSEEKLMAVMVDKAGEYFSEKMNSRGKIHIKPQMWQQCLDAANTLKTHDFTRIYFEAEDGVELYYQYQFVQELRGLKVKGMLDCMVVDHNNKTIYPVDLKTGEAPANMFDEIMLLHKYYLQASLYRAAIMKIVQDDPDLDGYTVADFEFVYMSKMNVFKPMIWVSNEELFRAGWKGFTDRFGFRHKGLNELIDLYKQCKTGRYGGYRPEIFDNDGRIGLSDLISEVHE